METTEIYKEKYEGIVNALNNAFDGVEGMRLVPNKYNPRFAPYMEFVRVDFLNQEDYPHDIADNSVYLTFKIDMKEGVFEEHSCGHIYLSANDSKRTNLCMTGLKNVCKAYGSKWLRKTHYKSPSHLAEKMATFAKNTFEAVKWYAGEYPYKRAIRDIYNDKREIVVGGVN